MFRRNPDAVAILVFGLVLLVVNVPRMALQHARWDVTPIHTEMRLNRDQVRAVQDEIRAHHDEIRAAAEEVRRAIHE